jgi:hypothetical protein
MTQSQAAGTARAQVDMQLMTGAAVTGMAFAMSAGTPSTRMLHRTHLWQFMMYCGTAAAAGT